MVDTVPELTNGEFNVYIKEGINFIDFFAEWCMPCVMMGPIIEDLAEEFEGKVKFGKINVDDEKEIAKKFEVSSIPTFIIFKEGQEVKRIIGVVNQDELNELIKKYI